MKIRKIDAAKESFYLMAKIYGIGYIVSCGFLFALEMFDRAMDKRKDA